MAFEWVHIANLRGGVGPVGPPGDGGFKGNLSTGADLNDYYGLTYDGYYAVTTDTVAASLLNAPADAKAGTFHVFKVGSAASNQLYMEYGSAGRVLVSAATSSGRSRPWQDITASLPNDPAVPSTLNGNRIAPISVTRGWGGGVTTGSGFAKALVTMPPKARRARIVVRNVNPRFTTADSASATLSTLSIGLSSGTADSSQTGVVTVATGASTGSSGYYSPWFDASAFAGKDAIIGLDWSSAGTVQTNVGFGWTGAGTGATSTGATGTSATTLPFHIYLEVGIPSSVPIIAAWGDSLSAAVGATRPVYDSWLNQYCRAFGAAAVHFAHSGDGMSGSWDAKSAKWKEFGGNYQAADAVICVMGSNDVFGGADLPTMQSRFLSALPSLKRFVSPNVYATTIMPRTGVTGAMEDVRRSYNTWLKTQDVREILQFAAASSADDEALRAEYDADGIHLNTAGYGALAAVLPRTLTSTPAVTTGDARLLDATQSDDVFAGFVGSDDRLTALTIGADGDLTSYAAGRVGKSVGVENVALDSGQTFVVVDSQDRIVFSDVDLLATEAALPTENWAHWGDSMTDDAVTGVDAWVNKLSALTGRSHFNGGWYQQTADQIAARQGGLPAIVTVSGNVTAATGATTITSIVNKPVLASSTRSVPGTLAGIPGFIKEPTSGNVQFTPDQAGVYSIPAKSLFIPTNGFSYKDRVVTIWSGRNNVPLSTDPILVVAAIRAMIDYLTPRVKRVIVMEVVPAEFDDSTMRTYTATLNAAIKAAFPEFWLDIATWLRTTDAAAAAGITFDSDDLTDIANGNTPGSFRSDSTHLNATGCTAVAARVYSEAQRRGWLA